MSEPTRKAVPHASNTPGARHKAGRIIVRVYALMILLVVVWTGYTAISYLAHYVFMAMSVPPQFIDPLAHGVPATQPGPSASADGNAAAPVTPEPAISHYHRDVQPFAFVGAAGCTTSGCHTLLPHTKRKEVRAFANFHSTFLDCSSCHDPAVQPPATAVWLDNRSGQQQSPPALLRLMTLLESKVDELQTKPAEISATIIGLLRDAETNVGVDPPLHSILIQLDTSEPGSPVWRQAATELQAALPNRVRGEYGARITPTVAANGWAERQSRLAELAAQFNAAAPKSPQRDQISKQIHEKVLAKPEACVSCHGGEPPRFDFQQLGYSPQRTAALRATPIARMIQQIRDGTPFHLPQLLESRNAK